jgi:outer membrane protein OmpA-like peptidoglycan-associated protein
MTALLLMALSLNVQADLDVGSGTTTKEDVINEFMNGNAAQENTPAPEKTRGMTRGIICKTRGLGDNSCNQPAESETVKAAPSREKIKPVKTVKEKHHASTSNCQEKGISMEISFDYNSDSLSAEAVEKLRPLGEAFASEQLRGAMYRVEGHTDGIGGDAYNNALSLRRADAVKNYLTQEFSFTGKTMQAIGKGKSDLADPENPASEKNRRVRLVKLDC